MALNFPANPLNGDLDPTGQWTYNGITEAWQARTTSPPTVVSQPTPPAYPSAGNLWYNSNDGTLYVYFYDGDSYQWVEVKANSSAGAAVATRVDALENTRTTRNYLLNADFNINQRSFTSLTLTSGLTYGFDRWSVLAATGTSVYSTQAFTPGSAPVAGYESKNYSRVVTSGFTSSGWSILGQSVEDVRALAGKNITISFWARAGSGTPTVIPAFEQAFGTGGSPSSPIRTTLSGVTIDTTWKRYSVTTTVPSIAGKTIGTDANSSHTRIELWFSGASGVYQNNTFDVWGVQVEDGTTATPFRTAHPSIQAELAACQRYYYRANGEWAHTLGHIVTAGTSSTSADIFLPFPVTMRVAPTSLEANGVEFSRPGVGEFSATSYSFPTYILGRNVGVLRCNFASALAATTMYQYRFNVSNGYIGWSAEL